MDYATLSLLIKDSLEQFDTAFVTELPNLIKQAEDRILKSVNLPVFQSSAAGATVAHNRFMTAPTGMLAPLSLEVIVNGVYTALLLKDPSLIYEIWGGNTEGPPVHYSLYNNSTLLLGPTPDQVYVTEMMILKRPTSIVDAGTSWLGDNAENALFWACMVEAYSFMKGEADLVQLYNANYQQALAGLVRLGEGLDRRDSFAENMTKVPVGR
jgi:hypothetical protein